MYFFFIRDLWIWLFSRVTSTYSTNKSTKPFVTFCALKGIHFSWGFSPLTLVVAIDCQQRIKPSEKLRFPIWSAKYLKDETPRKKNWAVGQLGCLTILTHPKCLWGFIYLFTVSGGRGRGRAPVTSRFTAQGMGWVSLKCYLNL